MYEDKCRTHVMKVQLESSHGYRIVIIIILNWGIHRCKKNTPWAYEGVIKKKKKTPGLC